MILAGNEWHVPKQDAFRGNRIRCIRNIIVIGDLLKERVRVSQSSPRLAITKDCLSFVNLRYMS
jgi:hypothetical protein